MAKKHKCFLAVLAVFWAATWVRTCAADSIAAPFSNYYTFQNIGTPTGLPGAMTAITFLNQNTMLIGGWGDSARGAVYAIGVTRDSSGHVNGYSGSAQFLAQAPYIDAGLQFGPGGDLFFTGFNVNTLGEILPGGTAPATTISLANYGISGTVGGLNFAPNGDLKLDTYKGASFGGSFYTATLSPTGTGTYSLAGNATLNAYLGFGAEGMLSVPAGSPGFVGNNILVANFGTSAGRVYAYLVDANYNPILSTRRVFMYLPSVEGATIDPWTGDFLFSTELWNGVHGYIDVVHDPPNFSLNISANGPTRAPEPASLLLLGVGLASIVWLSRRGPIIQSADGARLRCESRVRSA